MLEPHPTRPNLSHVELLLDEQRYEAALIPLAKLIEENPFDLQVRLYRLLTVRLLILHQILLTNGSSSTVNASPPAVSQGSSKNATALMNATRSSTRNWIQSLGHVIERSRSTRLVMRTALALGLTALFVAPGTFCIGVADQRLSGGRIVAVNERSVEGAHEPSRHGLAEQSSSIRDIKGDDAKLRMLGILPNSGVVLHNKAAAEPIRQANQFKVSSKQPSNGVRELQTIYKTKGSLTLRQEPRFGSESLQQIAEGTRLSVLGVNGNWLKVKADHSRAIGYLRKEFLVVANGAP